MLEQIEFFITTVFGGFIEWLASHYVVASVSLIGFFVAVYVLSVAINSLILRGR